MVRALAVLSALVLTLPAPAQGVLDEARRAADGVPAPPAPAASGGKGSSSWSSDGDDPLGELFGTLLAQVLLAPFVLPHLALEGDLPVPALFPSHPYALSHAEYLALSTANKSAEEARLKPWAVRFAVEEGNDFQGLNRVGARLWLDTGTRLGVSANFDHYLESCACGRRDQLGFADVTLTYRFAQAEWMQMHAGLGGRLMFGDGQTRGGFNFLYSADVFPVRPLVVSASMELGTVKEAFAMRLRASAGVQIRSVEAFVGWDWLRIGSADLWGPMAGVRLWF